MDIETIQNQLKGDGTDESNFVTPERFLIPNAVRNLAELDEVNLSFIRQFEITKLPF